MSLQLRRRMMKSAQPLFAHRGYVLATVDDIIAAAATSLATR